MHTYIIHFTLLGFCCPNMFRPSKGHIQGARLIDFSQPDQQNVDQMLNSVYLVA